MIQAQLEPGTEEPAIGIRGAVKRYRLSPTGIAVLLYATITLILITVGYWACDGHFVYPIDDSYIAMAMAKNLALHGVWGVSSHGFSSSSSSILYPLLLAAAYRITGINEFASFVLSWVFGVAAIFTAGRMLTDFIDRKWQTVVLILMVVFTPLFVLGMLGMEHSLHLLLTLLFLEYFLRQEPGERLVRLGAITTLMVATRYEGLFFVAGAFCLLVGERRWRAATTILAAGAVPVCAYAWFSLAHGGYWLPNSVALKGVGGEAGSAAGLTHEALHHLSVNYHEGFHLLLLLGLEATVLGVVPQRFSHRAFAPLALVFGAGCLHFCTARVGWVFRYEDYLIGAGIILLACAFPALLSVTPKRKIVAVRVLLLLTGMLLLVRSLLPAALLPLYSRNIYWQQWQMANLVRSYFANSTIAANDIGAIEYFSDARCVDLVGLANRDVFRARRTGGYTTQFLAQETETQGVKMAAVYDSWFTSGTRNALGPPSIPPSWVRVARWSTPEALQLGSRTVSFYATDAHSAAEVRDALNRYAGKLPKSVLVSGP
jgi:hypothetical protein